MEGWVRSRKTIRQKANRCKAMNSRIRRLPLGRPPRLRHSRQNRLKASTVDKLRIGSRAHLSSAILRSFVPSVPDSKSPRWCGGFNASCLQCPELMMRGSYHPSTRQRHYHLGS